MSPKMLQKYQVPSFEFYDLHPKPEDLRSEVLSGFKETPKRLSPKLFYDDLGSKLFAEICQLPEYYLTRTELGLLKEKAEEIASYLQESCVVIEYGCGSSEKIHLLLEAAPGCKAYAAVDIAKQALLNLTEGLAETHPHLEIIAMCADFMAPFKIPLNGLSSLPKVAFFPGSSIGNFDPSQAIAFLKNIRCEVGPGGGLLIGVDLKKDPRLLHAAYNDSRGITARFNKNILTRINRECAGDFDLSGFEHRAFYNEAAGRIEMHLVSTREQIVPLGESSVPFQKGETIHTENSYKYHREEFQDLARRGGWNPVQCWIDPRELMSLHFLRAR